MVILFWKSVLEHLYDVDNLSCLEGRDNEPCQYLHMLEPQTTMVCYFFG